MALLSNQGQLKELKKEQPKKARKIHKTNVEREIYKREGVKVCYDDDQKQRQRREKDERKEKM